MTTETMVNIISILAICISLANIGVFVYGRVQEIRVDRVHAKFQTTIPTRTPPLMKNRGVKKDEEADA